MNQKAIEVLLEEYNPENQTHKTVCSIGINHDSNGVSSPLIPSYVKELYRLIRYMDYSSFLKTLYWKAVSEQVKKNSGRKCKICSSKDNLQVHHNTYKNHGNEHFSHIQDTDLVCLCSRCHSLFHKHIDIKKGEPEKIALDLSGEPFPFHVFWDVYGKKKEKRMSIDRYSKLDSDMVLVMSAFLEYYIDVEVKYRMNPSHFIHCFLRGSDIKMGGNVCFYKDGAMYVR